MADAVEESPDRDHLYQVMVRYHDWLKKLSPVSRAELLELPGEQRVAKIVETRADQKRRLEQEAIEGEPLTASDFEHLLKWVEDYAWRIGPCWKKIFRRIAANCSRKCRRAGIVAPCCGRWQSAGATTKPPG